MRLKAALFEMKEAIVNQQVGQSEEDFIHKLEAKNQLNEGSLIYYFNHLMMVLMNHSSSESHDHSKKTNRKWTNQEIDFMFHYLAERQQEGGINITEILDEVAQLLTRGYQSVNYKYYSLIKARDQKVAANPSGYQFTTIPEKELPVRSTEVLHAPAAASKVNQKETSSNEDLLDILSGLITNVQQLPGLNLNELLRSLYHLTNMALQNQEAVQQMEATKSEIHLEKEALKDKLMKMEQQLLQEKKRNDELQGEVSKLAQEIMAFNQLGDAAKIQNLKSYNQRLNYLIDEFGLVLKVSG